MDTTATTLPADEFHALGEDGEGTGEDAPTPALPKSAFDKLKAAHTEAILDTTTEMDVPTFGGKLVARHRALDYDETEAIARAVALSKHPKKVLLGMVDTIIKSTEELLWREDPLEEATVPLAAELAKMTGRDEEPVRFEERLAHALDIDARSARAVVLEAFGKEMAVVSYYADLTRWMEQGRREVSDEFEGES